jgi:hypothetical protein
MRNQSEPRSLAAVKTPISQAALDQLFREARTIRVACRSCASIAPAPGLRIGASWTDQR